MAMGPPLGNTNSQKSRVVEQQLRRLALAEDYKRIRKMLNKILDKAAEGDIESAKFVTERLDGKPRGDFEEDGSARPVIQIALIPGMTQDQWVERFAPHLKQQAVIDEVKPSE